MKTPTIHMNGTSRKDLLESYMNAMDKLREAIQAVSDAYPNGRDYYVQESGAYQVAVAEQQDRLQRLTSVREEMEALAESVADHRV